MIEIKHQIVDCNPSHTYFHITETDHNNDGVKFVVRNDGHVAIMTCKVINELNNLYYALNGSLNVKVSADYNLKDATVRCAFVSESTVNYSDNRHIVKDVDSVVEFATAAWGELLSVSIKYIELERAIRNLKILFEKDSEKFENVSLMIFKESLS